MGFCYGKDLIKGENQPQCGKGDRDNASDRPFRAYNPENSSDDDNDRNDQVDTPAYPAR